MGQVGFSIGALIGAMIGNKGKRLYKKKTEKSAFAWLETDNFIRPSASGHSDMPARKLHQKFIKSLVNSTEEVQRKFVLLSMPTNVNDNIKLDYKDHGYADVEDCVDTMMRQFNNVKKYLTERGMGMQVNEASPFSTKAYYTLLGFESAECIITGPILY